MIDFKIMLIWFDDIRVDGGGDCLEYVMLGILKGNGIYNQFELKFVVIVLMGYMIRFSIVLILGIEMFNNNFKIYFIIDVDVKDVYLENEVKNGLKVKNLEFIVIFIGKCFGRRKRDGIGKNIFLIFWQFIVVFLYIWF